MKMRKSIVIIGLAVIVTVLTIMSFSVVNAYGFDRDNSDEISLSINRYGMTGYNYTLNSYEGIYLHLSTSNQEKIDLVFANELLLSDLNEKTLDEVIEVINLIKVDLLDSIQIEYSTNRFRMMGGNMMGYSSSNDQYRSCGYQDRVNTYEWLYSHSNTEQRQSLDIAFAEAIMQLEITTLSDQELVVKLTEIKLILVDQLLNPEQPIE